MNIGNKIAAFAVVAEMKAESTKLMIMKLKKTSPAFFPNFRINQSAKRLADLVFTSILASTNDKIFSHITL